MNLFFIVLGTVGRSGGAVEATPLVVVVSSATVVVVSPAPVVVVSPGAVVVVTTGPQTASAIGRQVNETESKLFPPVQGGIRCLLPL